MDRSIPSSVTPSGVIFKDMNIELRDRHENTLLQTPVPMTVTATLIIPEYVLNCAHRVYKLSVTN